MNNKEFIAQLAQTTGYSKETTQNFVRQMIETMSTSFDKGENVHVPGFGTFEVKKRLERVMVNPSTGKRMMVPPKLVLGFKPAASIKEQLKKGGE